MRLEALSANCFSSKFVLKVNAVPAGKYEARWFSESLDISFLGQRHLEFRRLGWLGSQFELVDPEAKEILAECKSSGLFTSSWDIRCAAGSGRLAKRGWFDTAYEFIQKQRPRAWVDRRGMCDRGWVAEGSEELTVEDLLFLGLIYHTLRQRQARQHQAGPHVAGT
jgi:hypothetical protein